MQMNYDHFSGKVVLVTGAGSGIGRSCTRLLLVGGARVVRVDRSFDLDPMESKDDRVMSVQGDVSAPNVMREAVERCVARYGALDCAINSAGIKGSLVPLIEQEDGALDDLYAVNVRGIFLSMKYELTHMTAQRRGSIVNVSSIMGIRSTPGFSLYSATKHAVVGITKGAALEVAQSGVRVNAVAPGAVDTPFIGRELSEVDRQHSPVCPLYRFASAEEIAHSILWLSSDAASYVTGEILSVDGGLGAQSATRLSTSTV